MNDKYISIITNFGCHYTCPYCIVKNNNLDIPRTTINGLDSLWLEIVRNQCNWVSLSGGGAHYGIIVNTRTGMINFLKLQKI